MSEIKNRPDATAWEEIARLRLENSKLNEELLELRDSLLFHTGLAGQMHRQNERMKQLKILLIRAAEALEKSCDAAHSQLVQELRKAAE